MIDKILPIALVEIKNSSLFDCESFEINEFFRIMKNGENTILVAKIEEKPTINSTPTVLLNALSCAFPDMLVSTYCKKPSVNYYKDFWKPNVLFSYYGYTDYKSKCKKQIQADDLCRLKLWHDMLIEHNEICLKNPVIRGTAWNVAFNEYLDSASCSVVEKAFIYLITALEALLVDGNNELNYRVALYAATLMNETYEEKIETFTFIKKCYTLRSKAVHGDTEGLKKNFKKDEVYEMLFGLKVIVSNILFRTYKKDKKDILVAIEKALLCSPTVIL